MRMRLSGLILLLHVFTVSAIFGQSYFYYGFGDSPYTLERRNYDGSSNTTVYTPPTGIPRESAADPSVGKIYFHDSSSPPIAVYKADADGSNRTTLFSGTARISSLTAGDGYLFYAYEDDPWSIRRINFDGSGDTQVYLNPSYGIIYAIAYDAVNNHLYFYEYQYDNSNNRIARVDADGSNLTVVYNNCPRVTCMAAGDGYVYYGFNDDPWTFNRRNSDGSNATLIYDPPTDYIRASAYDAASNYLYFYNDAAKIVYRSGLDGSGRTSVYSGFSAGINCLAAMTYSPVVAPTCSTSVCTTVTTTSADLGGNVTDDGGATVTERGVVYSSTDNTPTIGEAGVTKDDNGAGTGSFNETITGLTSGTRYWYRAYAINSAGTAYGDAERCTTQVEITFTNGADGSLDFQQANATPPENNWLCGQFSLNKQASSYGYLTSITATLGGTYDAGDLQTTPFQLYRSTSNSFGSASAVGTSQADPGSGGDVTFSGFIQYLSTGMNYFWITADISATATADDNMSATIDGAEDLSFMSGALTGSSSYGKLNAGSEASLPVSLSSFSAKAVSGGVLIQWATESEVNNQGFILESKFMSTDWTEIASYQTHSELQGQGNTSSQTEYQFTDVTVQSGETYSYRLSDVSTHGDVNILDVISITLNDLPDMTALEPPFPNPFNPQTKISYQLAESGLVNISVYDLLGRKVATLWNAEQQAGSYSIYWHGRDDSGRQASTGTYFLRLVAGDVVQSEKVLLMR